MQDIGYWRKANHIHEHMKELYLRKGGTDPEFNCSSVKLSQKDITELINLILSKRLKPTSDFFFGGNNIPEGIDTDTIKILCTALDAQSDNRDIYFSSWY